MKLNALYGVLTQLLTETPEFQLFDKIIPIHDRTLENKEYYRLELPLDDIAGDGLQLHEMHLSIYQKVDPNNPAFGPSHFTALFHDSQKQEFRMHVFLNRFDTLACPPSWELLDDDHHYVKVDPPESMEYLTHAIWQQGLPYLQQLRQQQKNLESRLCSDYNELERQTALLNIKLSDNKATYLENLQKLIQSVKLLSEISDGSNWLRVLSYLRKLQNIISAMPESSIEPIEKKEEAPKQGSHKKNQHQAKTGHSQHTLFSKSTKNTLIIMEIQRRIDRIKNVFDKMGKTHDNHIKALLLVDLNKQLVDIDLENESSLTSTQIELLSEIEAKVISQAKSLLQTALLKGEYDFSRTLSPFYNLINGNILSIALIQKNAKLLEFLAKDLGLPINSYPISIKERSYVNAVEYCFYESKESNSLLECFNVLIEQGASLMQPVDPDKLPLAHVILSAKPTHPLYAALEQNKSLTLNNQHFYTYLIHVLSSCLRSQLIEQEMKSELEAWIGRYEQLKIRAESQNLLLNPRNQLLAEEISEIAKKFFSTTMIEALQQDDDLLREHISINKETKDLLDKIKVYQRKTGKTFPYQSILNATSEDFKKELLKYDLKIDTGFSELKSFVLEIFSNTRLIISYSIEMFEVSTMMHQLPVNMGRRNRRLRELDNRQKDLAKKIEELNKTMPYSMIKEYNEFQENVSKIMGDAEKIIDINKELTKHLDVMNSSNLISGNALSDVKNVEHEFNDIKEVLTKMSGLLKQFGVMKSSNPISSNALSDAKNVEHEVFDI